MSKDRKTKSVKFVIRPLKAQFTHPVLDAIESTEGKGKSSNYNHHIRIKQINREGGKNTRERQREEDKERETEREEDKEREKWE